MSATHTPDGRAPAGRAGRWPTMLLACGALALLARAAPMLPAARISNEMQTLAGIQRVILEIAALPEPVVDAGIRPDRIRARWETRLDAAGIALVDRDSDFTLRLVVVHRVDESMPDGSGYCNLLMLQQPVHVARLHGTLKLPTWTGASVGISADKGLEDAMWRDLDTLIDDFIRKTALATRYR